MGRASRTPRRRQGCGLRAAAEREARSGPTEVSGGLGRGRAGRGCSLSSREAGKPGPGAGRRLRRGPCVPARGGGGRRPEQGALGPPGCGCGPRGCGSSGGFRSWGVRPPGRRRGGTGNCRLPSAYWGQGHATSAPSATLTAVARGSRVPNPILQRRRSGPKELGQGHAVGEPEL